jgi:hypothetical protein
MLKIKPYQLQQGTARKQLLSCGKSFVEEDGQ